MTSLAKYQTDFFTSLVEYPSEQLLNDIDAATAEEAAIRMAVYQNNYAHGMVQVLKDAYPVILRLVGDAFFSGLALEYAKAQPPQQATMQNYGADFPGYLAEHPACQELPFLSDVATIEYCYIQCFHGPEEASINLNHLLAEDEEQLVNVQFTQHPNSYLLASDYPALDIWYANLDDEVEELDLTTLSPSRVLIYRNAELQVETVQLNDLAFQFCRLLTEGHTIASAWETLQSMTSEPLAEDDLNGMLTYFLGLGVFSGLTIKQE